jgi:hypothetical protein
MNNSFSTICGVKIYKTSEFGGVLLPDLANDGVTPEEDEARKDL